MIRLFFGSLFLALISSDACFAQLSARFTADGVANCQSPPLANFPIHVEGVGRLLTSGEGSMDVSGITGPESYRVKLGPRRSEAAGGSASLRVASRNSLRAIREYPNNYAIFNIRVAGKACSLTVENILKPGKRQYSFVTSYGIVAYCSKPVFTRTTCTPQ
jgi:hypothetical protein